LSEEGITRARAIEEPFTLAIALDYAAMLYQFDHNYLAAQKLTEEVIELCTKHHFAYYLAWARIIHGWTTICAGDSGVGLAEMRTGLDDFEKTGAGLRLPYYLSLLADGQGRNGQPEKALATVDLALQRANTNGEKWHNADLFRLRAQMLLQMNSGKTSDAETAFLGALNIAREQGCKARELQIATELGRFWQSQGKQREAHDLVATIYGRFPNLSENVYVKNAKALLEEFS
jgi:predicted ATPase